MKTLNVLGLLVSAAVALVPGASAASAASAYSLTDVGTLGGPQAFLNLPGGPLTNDGEVLGTADTAIADPNYPNFNPFLTTASLPGSATTASPTRSRSSRSPGGPHKPAHSSGTTMRYATSARSAGRTPRSR